jgi:microcystin-dependent protein
MPAVNRYYSSVAIDTTLKFAITDPDATSIEVNSTSGFPTSYPYTLALGYDLSNEELVTIIGASDTTLTVGVTVAGGASSAGRGVDGTNNQTHVAGEAVKHVISARDMTEAQAHIAGEADVHGLATAGPSGASGGTVVGTTATQTLTNKTITGGTVNATTLQQGGVPAVTTTGTQELTNKTLTSPAISNPTISGTITGAVVTSANIVDGTIVNADINASAAIVATKLTGTITQFNDALSGADFTTIAGTETLLNKTLTNPKINEDVVLTATSTELNKLDGVNATTAELNKLAGATATTAELNYVTGVTSAIQDQLNALIPAATITMYGASTAPTGWLLCDGAAVSRTTYATLFGIIGTEYGVGDNTTTFNLPDLKGRAPVGFGAGSGLTNRSDLGAKFGTETQTLTEANLPAHNHATAFTRRSTTAETHDHDSWTAGDFAAPVDDRSGATETTTTVTKNSDNTGSGTAHNNLQPSTVVNFIIKH